MDPHTFEGMIRKLSATLSRRSLVGGSVGASVLAAVGLGEETLAKKHRVTAEACIPTGKRCPSPKPRGRKGNGKQGKDAKQLSCAECCQRHVITSTNAKGKRVKKCACKPVGLPCTQDTRWQCCTNVCAGDVCAPSSTPPTPSFCEASGSTLCVPTPGASFDCSSDPSNLCACMLTESGSHVCLDMSAPREAFECLECDQEGEVCAQVNPPGNTGCDFGSPLVCAFACPTPRP